MAALAFGCSGGAAPADPGLPGPPDPPAGDTNRAPQACVVTTPATVAGNIAHIAGFPIEFDLSCSSDPDNDFRATGKYSIDYGDGTSVEDITPSIALQEKVYALSGSYPVTVTVTDDQGLTDTENFTVSTRGPVPPIVCVETTPAIDAGAVRGPMPLQVTIDASCSTDPDGVLTDGGAVRMKFHAGDSFAEFLPFPANAVRSHTYPDFGSYEATVEVRDRDGSISSVPVSVVVLDTIGPEICLETDPAAVGGEIHAAAAPLQLNLDLGCSVDPNGDLRTNGLVSFDFGDGVRIDRQPFAVYENLNKTYFSAGEFQVLCTVIDGNGNEDSTSVTVVVAAP